MLGPRSKTTHALRADRIDESEEDEREQKRAKVAAQAPISPVAAESALASVTLWRADSKFRISVKTMNGAVMIVDNVSASDTVLSVKKRVFALNGKLPVRRQRLVYSAGPLGMEPLGDKDTLGGAGVVEDGSAELTLVLMDLTDTEVHKLNCKGLADKMLQLLNEGANIDYKDGAVKNIFSFSLCCLQAQTGRTALICASENGCTNCVRLLVEGGADTDAKNKTGYAALHLAARRGHSDIVRVLVDSGANKNIGSRYNQHLKIYFSLPGSTALMLASLNAKSHTVRLLIELGADTDARSDRGSGSTALILAVLGSHSTSNCVRLLLESGASKDIKDKKGLTALGHALKKGHSGCIDLLMAE